MKIIDLLVKISKGEEVPKKIIVNGIEFEIYTESPNIDYRLANGQSTYLFQEYVYTFGEVGLNDEIEILDNVEEKEIEMLFLPSFEEFRNMTPAQRYKVTAIEYDKLNEIIELINDMRDKEC